MTKVKTIDDLRLHKLSLKMKLHQSEHKITSDWNYLRLNAKKLIWSQINPFSNNGFMDGIVSALQSGLLPLVMDFSATDADGKPSTKKALFSSIKYFVATLGLKLIKSFVQSQKEEEHS